jgi:thioredoxin reductase
MAGAPERHFSYRGRRYEARPGETLLTALLRDGLPTLGRSNRYHRPRAPFCGVGQCTGCLVGVNGRPAVRACRYLPEENDVVHPERGWPSPRFDVLGILDSLFPRGIDTLHGFRWPRFATPLYHRLIRRLAGYGEPPPEPPVSRARTPPSSRTTDIVVVGGGRSGAAVAARLVAQGLRPLVVERGLTGGVPSGAEGMVGTTGTFLPSPKVGASYPFTLLGFTEPGGGLAVRARTVVVATGGYDATLLFGGNDRPGVLTADAALEYSGPGRPLLFRRAVVVGGGPRAKEVLDRCGPEVSAVVAPGEIGPEVVRLASDLDVPLYPRSILLRADGRSRVRTLHLKPRGNGPGFSLPCDAIVLAHRRLPNVQLFFQAGARMEWRGGVGAYYPVLDPAGATSVPGLYAAGEAAGVLGVAREAGAARVAEAVAGRPPPDREPLPRVAVGGPADLDGYYRELLRGPRRGRWMACVCEDVLLEEVENAVRAGYRGIEVVRRYSSLGTGLCQGRYCLPDALLVLSILEGRPPSEVGYITPRPPVFPTPLSALAGLYGMIPTEGAP